jgi:3-hydroxyisobutyrate dehydrogenase-like beta-hydroxyacid dehydrogenase
VRFRLDLMAKDLDIVTRMAQDLNVPLEIGNRVREYLQAAQAQGLGAASNSAWLR